MNIEISRFDSIAHSPVAKLLPFVFMEMYQDHPSGAGIDLFIDWDSTVLMASVESKIAGFIIFTENKKTATWEVRQIFTVPEFRRKGVFRTLLQTLKMSLQQSSDCLNLTITVPVNNAIAQQALIKEKMDLASTSFTYHAKPHQKAKMPFDINLLDIKKNAPATEEKPEKDEGNVS